jgi:hypothetical protein
MLLIKKTHNSNYYNIGSRWVRDGKQMIVVRAFFFKGWVLCWLKRYTIKATTKKLKQ